MRKYWMLVGALSLAAFALALVFWGYEIGLAFMVLTPYAIIIGVAGNVVVAIVLIVVMLTRRRERNHAA